MRGSGEKNRCALFPIRRQIPAPAAEVNTRKHQLVAPGRNKAFHLLQNCRGRQASGRTARLRNDAECAAISATLLNLEVGARLGTRNKLRLLKKRVSKAIVDPDGGCTGLPPVRIDCDAHQSGTGARGCERLQPAPVVNAISGASALWLLPTTAATPAIAGQLMGRALRIATSDHYPRLRDSAGARGG